ncbi:hypothetical protein A6R68_03368, partial [Neotoma lepida]
MLNVPSQAFPAPGSQQRVASQGRSKNPSLSSEDHVLPTKLFLQFTNQLDLDFLERFQLRNWYKNYDGFLATTNFNFLGRGLVYNVSPYMEYHPGGEDELMRAAGADGTDLFNEVHRWVNYESMLKECLVGRMAMKPVVPKGAEIVKPYTPVSESLLSDFKEPVLPPNKYIYFLIKIYPDGLFTPELDRLQIDCPSTPIPVTRSCEKEMWTCSYSGQESSCSAAAPTALGDLSSCDPTIFFPWRE